MVEDLKLEAGKYKMCYHLNLLKNKYGNKYEPVTVNKKKKFCSFGKEYDGEQWYQETIEGLIKSINEKE